MGEMLAYGNFNGAHIHEVVRQTSFDGHASSELAELRAVLMQPALRDVFLALHLSESR